MSKDLIGVVEAAYRLDGTDDEWLDALTTAMTPLFGRGFGVGALRYQTRRGWKLRHGTPIVKGTTPTITRTFELAVQAMPPWLVRQAVETSPRVISASEALTKSGALPELVSRFSLPHGIRDLVSLRVMEGERRGVLFCAASAQTTTLTSGHKRRWGMCAAHIGAAMRLRANLHKRELVDAVMEVDGRVVHAESERAKAQREALSEAARTIERARGRMREVAPNKAFEAWRGLVDGRWSLVETIESDGHRYLIVRRNEPWMLDPRALSPRERQIVSHAARGEPLKLIAYELGLGISTVGEHLQNAMRKLGVSSRAELLQLLHATSEA